ncbi:hypothetical protein D3C71_972110 [compost metagenome]
MLLLSTYMEQFDTLYEKGKAGFSDIIRTALYRHDETIFDRLDFYNDRIVEEPLLYCYFNSTDEHKSLDQVLFGYYAREKRPQELSVFSNRRGKIYLPYYGTLLTERGRGEFTLFYDSETDTISLSQNDESVAFAYAPISVLEHYPDIEVTSDVDPHAEKFFLDFAALTQEEAEFFLAYKPIEITQYIPDIEEAFRLMDDLLPEDAEKIRTSIKKIVLFYHPKLRNFATRESHGTIFLNVEETANVSFFLEEIIHQGSHIVFNNVTFDTSEFFQTDPNALLSDYVANDSRTLYGAFHGIYTTCKIVDLLIRVIDSKPVMKPEVAYEIIGRLAVNKNRHEIGLETVPYESIFTDLGKTCMDYYFTLLDENIHKNSRLFDFDIKNHPVVFDYEVFEQDNPIEQYKHLLS